MSYFLESLPPRSFKDFTVPARADGSLMTSCRPGEYEIYVAWLADYLHQVELPLSADQLEWLGTGTRAPEMVIFACSDAYGYAAWELDGINDVFKTGTSYEACVAEDRRRWDEHTAPEDREEYPFEELSQDCFERLRREHEECSLAGVEWHHADIPYRPLLGWALRQIPDADTRRKVVDHYFRNFQDNASK